MSDLTSSRNHLRTSRHRGRRNGLDDTEDLALPERGLCWGALAWRGLMFPGSRVLLFEWEFSASQYVRTQPCRWLCRMTALAGGLNGSTSEQQAR